MWWVDLDDVECRYELGFLTGVCFLAFAELVIGTLFWVIL